jgi:hypothetical protein
VQAARAALAAAAAHGDSSWTDPAVEVLAHCWEVLSAVDEPAEAAAVLAEGRRHLEAIAAGCGPALRATYLENVRECRVLRAAAHPHAPFLDGAGPLPAPEEPVGRKVAARQAELLVLAADAARRGDALDEEALARNFGVSLRTIQRDLAALRRAGRI